MPHISQHNLLGQEVEGRIQTSLGFRARHLLRLPWGAQVTTVATFLLPVLATPHTPPTLAVFSQLQVFVA